MESQNQEFITVGSGHHTSHIPGYAGFIPAIKGENLFGKTYGQITDMSANRAHHRGSDPDELKYTTTIADSFQLRENCDSKTIHIQQQNPLKRLNYAQTIGQTDADRVKKNYGKTAEFQVKDPRLPQQTNLTYQQARERAQQQQ